MIYTQEITLDLNPNIASPIISAKQNDIDSRVLLVHYTQDGAEYKVSRSNSVALRLRKPDMHMIFNDGIINEDGTVSVELTRECLAVAGRAYADLVEFNSEGQTLSTSSFIINIQASPDVMGSEAVSSDEFLYLKSFIDKGMDIIGQAQEWVDGYNGDTPVEGKSKNNAKYYSQRAEAWASGTIDGINVDDEDSAYNNNAKYYVDSIRDINREAQRWAIGTASNTQTPSETNNAKYYAGVAEQKSEKIKNMQMNVIPGDALNIERTETDDSLSFELTIPKSEAAFVTFDVDYTNGELIMYRPDVESLSDEVDFAVNESGELEVSFNVNN